MHALAYSWLVPVFFVSIGLQANAREIGLQGIPLALVIVAVAVVSKILGCGLGARLGGLSGREALQVGTGMLSRGEVGLIVASILLEARLIAPALYSTSVVMVLATTLLTPPLLRLVYRSRPQPA